MNLGLSLFTIYSMCNISHQQTRQQHRRQNNKQISFGSFFCLLSHHNQTTPESTWNRTKASFPGGLGLNVKATRKQTETKLIFDFYSPNMRRLRYTAMMGIRMPGRIGHQAVSLAVTSRHKSFESVKEINKTSVKQTAFSKKPWCSCQKKKRPGSLAVSSSHQGNCSCNRFSKLTE